MGTHFWGTRFQISFLNLESDGRMVGMKESPTLWYFILSEEKETPKKAAAKKTDPATQIRKYDKLRDDGLITKEEYDAKKKELLGL